MKLFARFALAGCLLVAAGAAHADEGKFLQSFQGNFAGKGVVKIRTNAPAVNVTCSFKSSANATTLSLDGTCRGLLLLTRDISANLKVSGARYSGIYIGSRSGPAQLSGSRSGNAINLVIHWAKEINGDRNAGLTVEKTAGGMRLTVTDLDPRTHKNVVTSRIDLRRS